MSRCKRLMEVAYTKVYEAVLPDSLRRLSAKSYLPACLHDGPFSGCVRGRNWVFAQDRGVAQRVGSGVRSVDADNAPIKGAWV